jgi:release factor glutamine methyltransferase
MSNELPEAYELGTIPFLGLTIHLDSRPLIPRPETEWWTEELIKTINARAGVTPLKILDLCSGSGAIGCAILKQCPNAHVYFGEIDPAHRSTITKNIQENRLDESRAEVRIGDLFEPFDHLRFDCVAANPPYIPESRELPRSVAEFEPALALRAGADGLRVLRRIVSKIKNHLTKDGRAWIECDSLHADEARNLFTAEGLVAKIRNDQYERPRILVVSWSP